MMKNVPLWLWTVLVLVFVVSLLSFVTVFQAVVYVHDSVSWDGLTYVCQDDKSLLSVEQQFIGCRLCAMESLSFNDRFGVPATWLSKFEGVALYGFGDCVAKFTSTGRVKYVWEGFSVDRERYQDNDDFDGYVSVVRDRFVSWSVLYDYCPTKGFIRDEGLGACMREVIVEEPVSSDDSSVVPDLSPVVSPVIVEDVVYKDFGVPLWLYLVVGLLSLSIILFLLAGKKGR